ncbi:MAG: hypothetical protein LBG80_07625 [Bacteroidales bacterium]|nr:hypothetical protein [Bacteroidales bacterium]
MENVNGGGAVKCGAAVAFNAVALASFILTGGIGWAAWLAIASYGYSVYDFVNACKDVH